MGYFKGNEIACTNISGNPKHQKSLTICACQKNIISVFEMFWTEPPFRANLVFGYVQSSPERTSFSGSTVESSRHQGMGGPSENVCTKAHAKYQRNVKLEDLEEGPFTFRELCFPGKPPAPSSNNTNNVSGNESWDLSRRVSIFAPICKHVFCSFPWR